MTSFADATKLSMETTVLANATGFGVGRRGMFGPACGYVRDLAKLLPAEAMLGGGIVDYSVGASPHTGGFVVVHEENPYKRTQLAYYKLGDGPFYVFYTPFHLPHIQLPSTIARAVLHRDATVAPLRGPSCEVVAVAKRDLKAGETLDGVGGFCAYGLIENRAAARGDQCAADRDVRRLCAVARRRQGRGGLVRRRALPRAAIDRPALAGAAAALAEPADEPACLRGHAQPGMRESAPPRQRPDSIRTTTRCGNDSVSNIVVLGSGMAGFGAAHRLRAEGLARWCTRRRPYRWATASFLDAKGSCSTSARTSRSQGPAHPGAAGEERGRPVRGAAGQARQLSGAVCGSRTRCSCT